MIRIRADLGVDCGITMNARDYTLLEVDGFHELWGFGYLDGLIYNEATVRKAS